MTKKEFTEALSYFSLSLPIQMGGMMRQEWLDDEEFQERYVRNTNVVKELLREKLRELKEQERWEERELAEAEEEQRLWEEAQDDA